jgi:hypothetical protein
MKMGIAAATALGCPVLVDNPATFTGTQSRGEVHTGGHANYLDCVERDEVHERVLFRACC